MIWRRASPDVRLTVAGFERNDYGVLMALILVSNTGPHSLLVGTTGVSYNSGDTRPLQPHATGIWTVPVPTFGRCRASVQSMRARPTEAPLMERVIEFIDTVVLRRKKKPPFDTHTVQVRK